MERQNPTDPMKMIFNYNNIFFSFFYDDTSGCTHRSREFAMNYVYSGEMLLDNGKYPQLFKRNVHQIRTIQSTGKYS